MSLGTPKAGFAAAGEFQSSALPFVTSSQVPNVASAVMRIDFPKVSRFITIHNHENPGQHLRIGFTRNGVRLSGNYFSLDGDHNVTFEIRVKAIYLAGDVGAVDCSLLAGLTTVDSSDMPLLSGTLVDGSSGWAGVG